MMGSSAGYALLSLLVSAAPIGLNPSDAAIRALVGRLALGDLATFHPADPLAIVAAPEDRTLAERTIGHLRATGLDRVFLLPHADEPAAARARDLGAQWLLEIAQTMDELQARLRQIDGGLWNPPAAGILATARVPLQAIDAPPGSDLAGPNPRAGVYGPLMPLGELPGEPLALAACADVPDRLIVLTRSHVFRVRLGDGWKVEAELPLDGLEPTSVRSRFPVGTVTCAVGQVGFATSDLATGYRVDTEALSAPTPLSGAPMATDGQSWRFARLHDGVAAWRDPDGALTWGHPGGLSDLVLVTEGAIHRAGAPLTPSGLGATAAEHEGRVFWVRTGLGRWGEPDEVQLGVEGQALGPPVALPTSVRATALGRFTGDAWTLVVAWSHEGRSVIQGLRVVMP